MGQILGYRLGYSVSNNSNNSIIICLSIGSCYLLTCMATTSTSSSLAVYTSKIRKCATLLFPDNYAIAKQRNVALFFARMQVASDDSKFFICALKSGATVPQFKRLGYRYPSYLCKSNAYGLSSQNIGLADCHHLVGSDKKRRRSTR